MCKSCKKAWCAAYYVQNKDRHRAAQKEYLRKPENRAKRLAQQRAYRARAAEHMKQYAARYRKERGHIKAANVIERLAKKYQATPKWRNTFFIGEIYHLAKLRTQCLGVKHHVDHIVPLRHPLVCGLHVEHNLRVVPARVNQQKSNRTWPDMPEAIHG